MSNFKRYIFTVLLGAILSCLLYIAIALYQLAVPVETSRHLESIYRTISVVANSFDEPKLVIVAGSSASAGISCQLIYEQTGKACVNGGVHAGLDIDYLLYRARDWIQAGDTVLLPLEYSHYVSGGIPVDLFIDYIFSYDPYYLRLADPITKARLVFGISFLRIVEGIKTKHHLLPPFELPELFSSRSKYGDANYNQESARTEAQLKDIASLSPISGIKGSFGSTHGTSTIKKFVEWCNSNGVKVVATYPNTIYFPVYEQEEHKKFFASIQKFYDELGVPVLGKPQDFMYDYSYFFDSIYHLHDRGTIVRTQQLISLMRPYLQ